LQEQRLFISFAAPLMRQLLLRRVDAVCGMTLRGFDVPALDDALHRLESLAPRHAHMIDLRYFCGLTLEETAHYLAKNTEETERDLRFIKAWLANARNQYAPRA
jgi:hypothetical protein